MSPSANSPVPKHPEWYILQAREVEIVRQVMVRLYSERRFGPDEMRDLAQRLNAAFDGFDACEARR